MKVHIVKSLFGSKPPVKRKSASAKKFNEHMELVREHSGEFRGNISYRNIDKSIHIASAKIGRVDSARCYTLKPDGTILSQSIHQKKPIEYKTYNTWALYGKIKDQLKAAKGKMSTEKIETFVNDIEKVIKH